MGLGWHGGGTPCSDGLLESFPTSPSATQTTIKNEECHRDLVGVYFYFYYF